MANHKQFWLIAGLLTVLTTLLFLQDFWYFFSFDRDFPWLKNIIYFYFHIPFWMAVYPLIRMILDRFPWGEKRWLNGVIILTLFYLISLVKFVLHFNLTAFVQNQLGVGEWHGFQLFKSFYLASTLGEFFIYIFIAIFLTLYRTIENYHQEQEEKLLLQNQLSLAEIDTLKMQMQPHFLFNTLNSLSSLVEEKSELANEMIIHLADFLRYSLDYKNENFVALKDELDFSRNYLEIERLRFKDRLNVEYRIDQDLLEEAVPTFLLQPLLENAIKHGLSKQAGKETIDIVIKRENHAIALSVTNGSRFPGEITYGNGLSNLEERLKQLYNGHYSLQINQTENKFTINIKLAIQDGIYPNTDH
ncbi:MAG: histidine kinase [Calditrichaeota bacterium]|nr:histidine kinase [Calditrichota bacterium]